MSENANSGSPAAPAGAPGLKHELRTPLNHIIGYCEMLMEEAQDHRRTLFLPDLERIHTAGRHLLSVINDLFDVTKAPAYRSDPSLLDHEVRTPLNQIIGYAEMLQEEAQEHGEEAFNADLGKIHAAARQLLARIIERFGQAQTEGTTLSANSASGATTFLRKQSALPPSAAVDAQGAGVPTASGAILAVDDDPANREMLARRLERLGHAVRLAKDGREALEWLRQQSFDLVLLDLQMPELNGYEVLQSIKADPALRHLPVIVLSASDESVRVAHCIELGAADYLPKPFDPVLLQARIGACLEQKFLRDREVSYLRQIQEEKQRADELLQIILPRDVAEELKATQMVRPRRFENVAVLFCDIVGFTAYCNDHSPEEVLLHLQALVQQFEKITALHSLEKIKTIGDAFMATAGMLTPCADPALAGARCGLAMIAAARELPPCWQVRVGLHVGPVIAGVVGRRKYQYDVWGDTVNLAARLEELAEPDSLCVSASTWQLLAPQARGQSRGRQLVQGKGEIEIFRVAEILSGTGQDGDRRGS